MKKLSFKEFIKKEKGIVLEAFDFVASPSTPNAYLDYTNYLAENLEVTSEYTKYIVDNLENTNDYSSYIISNLEKNLSYTEYIYENMFSLDPRKKIYARRKRIISRLLR